MELRLPAEKLARVHQTVSEWLGRKAARRRELESLFGILQHASKVVRPVRFVRRLIQVMSSVKGRDHFVRLGVDVRSDLMWWQLFLETWNGIGILLNSEMGHIEMFTDASGKWGCAGVWDTMWFHWKWSEKAREWHIAPKELLPVVLVCIIWGKEWRGKKVTCHCDNMAVVKCLTVVIAKIRI